MANLVELYFSKADHDAILAATQEAEAKTSGEIVVRVASRSKNWAASRLLSIIVFGILAGVVAAVLGSNTSWGMYVSLTQITLWTAVGMLFGFLWWFLVSMRTANRKDAVWQKAMEIFRRLPATKGGTGVLIFLSLYEEEAAIIGDKQIAEKLSADFWDRLHAKLDGAIECGDYAEGIIETIEDLGVHLAAYFPHQPDDVNELPDGMKSVD